MEFLNAVCTYVFFCGKSTNQATNTCGDPGPYAAQGQEQNTFHFLPFSLPLSPTWGFPITEVANWRQLPCPQKIKTRSNIFRSQKGFWGSGVTCSQIWLQYLSKMHDLYSVVHTGYSRDVGCLLFWLFFSRKYKQHFTTVAASHNIPKTFQKKTFLLCEGIEETHRKETWFLLCSEILSFPNCFYEAPARWCLLLLSSKTK